MNTSYTLPPTPSVALPPPIERTWLDLARAETPATTDRDTIYTLVPELRRLSDRFTTDRPAATTATAANHYFRTPRQALAYTLCYAPRTYVRTLQILRGLPLAFPPSPAPMRILSLGSGTGADLLALLDHLSAGPADTSSVPPPRPIQAMALDHSAMALRVLRDAFDALRPARWPRATLKLLPGPLPGLPVPAYRPEAPVPRSAFDIVSLHYVLNELSPNDRFPALAAAADAVAPGGWLVLCEPLLNAEGDYLRTLRSWAIDNLAPLALLAPCPHTGPCPLPEPCHSVRSWTIPRTLQIISTALHRDLRRLDYAFLAFRRPLPADPIPLLPARPAWTVASAHDLKGRTEVPACLPDGTTTLLRLLHRHCDAPTKKRLRHLDRGTPIPLPS